MIPIENTTEIFTQKDKDQQQEKKNSPEAEKRPAVEHIPVPVPAAQVSSDTFILSDMQQNRHTQTLANQKLAFHHLKQPIVLINLFATWCPPCRGGIPYLSDLQKKYKKSLFIAGVLVNDESDSHTLKEFIKKYHADYFISNSSQNDVFAAKLAKELHLPENFPIPLTVIYKEGNYYRHYEGAVPAEMIEHDIKQAMKK